ncbi:flagellar hook protein FlgE [Caldichromatium japonicum]|uniref:Flagellar hook protein FlgE n=1 Tax=Caldichromatium japonicum TaxID=2699430 RepID=A0A6G7VDQ0_9GAMM|nr:flagellar hook protein FlgE [Caldichromatium japonicum]QIK37978.1 flagellar hook protein FlgE [Caldichromatium japonicum]
MPFRIGLSGLQAAAADLEVTGNNIANVATVGFKESRAEFANVYSEAYAYINKISIGSGVRLAAVTQQFSQGNLEYTQNALDLGINGQGFFVVEDADGLFYTRNGAFQVDRNGYVVNSQGQRLQVFPPNIGNVGVIETTFNTGRLEDIQLDFGDISPKGTTQVNAQINLRSDATQPIDQNGEVIEFNMNNPDSYNYSTSVTVYDSLGTPRVLTLYFVKGEEPLNWTAYASLDGSEPIQFDMTFDSNGNLSSTGLVELTFDMTAIDPNNGATIGPIDPNANPPVGTNVVTLNISSMTQYGTQYSVSDLTQDGYTTGRLSNFDVDQNGIVYARYTNGQSQILGQVALANFKNPQGLLQVGDNNWAATLAAGDPVYNAPGHSSLGLIQSGALEASNVDLTEELVNLITAQRNFQANAQTISTADQITQTIINLR